MLLIAPIPISGQCICRSHMAEKSPIVQPTKHRKVLTAALPLVYVHVQNWVLEADKVAIGGAWGL